MLRALLSVAAPPLCLACGAETPRAGALCAPCRVGLRWLAGSPDAAERWAPLAYEGPAAALVSALKFRALVGVADLMAAQMAANAPDWLRGAEAGVEAVLVPVPLHAARRRRRGFNQAELLARALSARLGLGVEDCLVRAGGRGTQMGRDRAERASALAGAFTARRAAPPRAILVDDVVTTGATLHACAAALRAAGAVEVRAVAYARTPGR